MINIDKTKMAMILIEAIIPNSFKSELLVKIKVANPAEVVMFVIKVAFPTFEITRCNYFVLFPCFLISCWYLLMINMAFGTPITIINGGINAVRIVIS